MRIYWRKKAALPYLCAAVMTFIVAIFQLVSYYRGTAESVSLFADTFHAGSDGITLLGTLVLLSLRIERYFDREAYVHRAFTIVNIGLLFVGVGLAAYELYTHAGAAPDPSWMVVVVATIGGAGDFLVWRLLLSVDKYDMPKTLRTNHAANVLHIKQDLLQSWVVVLSGVAIRFSIPYVDTVLGALITFLIFWEGVGLLYEEVIGRRFPLHFHLFGDTHVHNERDSDDHHH